MAIVKPPTVIIPDEPGAAGRLALPLPDGRLARLRTVDSTDGAHLLRPPTGGCTGLSFLRLAPGLDDDLVDHLLQVAGPGRRAVVATVGDELIGVGRVERPAVGGRADVVVVVAEGFRGVGLERAISGALKAWAHRPATTPSGSGGES